MQKYLIIISLLIITFIGVFFTPFISRELDINEFKLIGILLMLNAFYGVFDILKPVFIKDFSKYVKSSLKVPVYHFYINLRLALIFTSLVFIILYIFYRSVFSWVGLFLVTFASFFSFLSVFFISTIESNNKVGISVAVRSFYILLLYISFLFSHLLGGGDFYFYFYFLIFLFMFISYVMISIKYIDFNIRKSRPLENKKDIFTTLELNIFKALIDFGDRFVLVGIISGVFYAAYLAIYDLLSKSNILAQYLSNFYYPKILNDMSVKDDFITKSIYITILMVSLSLIASVYSEQLIGIYLGHKYVEFHYLVPLLSLVAVLYSLAFYSQVILRVDGSFKKLTFYYRVSSIIGLSMLILFSYLSKVEYILLSVLVMKSPGLVPYLSTLKQYLSKTQICLLFISLLFYFNFLIWLSFSNALLCFYGTSFVAFIFSLVYFFEKRNYYEV